MLVAECDDRQSHLVLVYLKLNQPFHSENRLDQKHLETENEEKDHFSIVQPSSD